jgi:hypothetical protein
MPQSGVADLERDGHKSAQALAASRIHKPEHIGYPGRIPHSWMQIR